ncbi:MAG: sodium:calcium antiporter [Bacteroidota bacterium]
MNILLSLLFISLSFIIIWRSSHGFEVASDFLGRRLPPGIKGATINAIASSMPEFLTTIFFLFYLRDADGFSGGLGVTSGSALFNLLIIPALVVLMLVSIDKGRKIRLNKQVLLREGLVLLLAQILFVIFLFNAELRAQHGVWLVLLYMAYLLLLFLITRKKGSRTDPGFESPVAGPPQSWLIRLLSVNITHLVLNGRSLSPKRAWILLGGSTVVMTMGTWLLVVGTDMFGDATRIPLIFVAVVLSAIATSVPDTIISIKDARKGNYDDAVSNALGSNIFDIAFALGLPILLYNLINGESITLPPEIQAFTQEVWVFLLFSTVLALVILLAGKHFTRTKAWILLGIYAIFLLFVGTQIQSGLSVTDESIGKPIGEFLTRIADWLGERIY